VRASPQRQYKPLEWFSFIAESQTDYSGEKRNKKWLFAPGVQIWKLLK